MHILKQAKHHLLRLRDKDYLDRRRVARGLRPTPLFNRSTFVTDLDCPLLRLSHSADWTLRMAAEGLHICGQIGAGKTTAASVIAGAFLRAGMGGCITVAKPTEIALWRRYAKENGRENSLVIFDEKEGLNFLDYILAVHGLDGIGTVVECLMRILEASKRVSAISGGGGADQDFWENSSRMWLRYSIAPIYAAYGSVSIKHIIDFISSAPESREERDNAAWQAVSFMHKTMYIANTEAAVPMSLDAMKNIVDFWQQRYVQIPQKTRGNVVITVGAVLDRFLHGRLQKAFCERTTLCPELSFHGALIVLAMPTLTWGEDGVIAQQLFKFLWQKSVLSRNSLDEKHRERPVFLWCDEAQETVSAYDFEYQSLCREMKACTVYLTQSLTGYYAKLGGSNGRDAAHALVGRFNSHLYLSNACPETNEYASRMLGRVVKLRKNISNGTSSSVNFGATMGYGVSNGTSSSYGSSSSSTSGGQNTTGSNSSYGTSSNESSNWGASRGTTYGSNMSTGFNEAMESAIEPGDFARNFKTGGPQNGNLVTGIWFQSARNFEETGTNFMVGTFKQ